jgi:hypothetical protein
VTDSTIGSFWDVTCGTTAAWIPFQGYCSRDATPISRTTGERKMTYDLWSYRETAGLPAEGLDLTGYKVEASDGGVGKVDEASHETGASRLVVDTGPWIFGKKVMLPAAMIEQIDPDEQKIYLACTREQIENSPEYDPERHRQDPAYRDQLGKYYADYFPGP